MRFLAILLLLLQGCAQNTFFYDADNKLLGRVEQPGAGLAIYKEGDKEISVDTRQPNIWERNIIPILSGSIDRASRAR